MRDPQPALFLFICQALALAAVLGWWLTLPPARRAWQLARIARVEDVQARPPAALPEQAGWLLAHRLGRLRRTGALAALAAVIGLAEGWERRRRHPYGGLGFVRLVLGQLLATLTVGAAAASLIVPWPLPPLPAAAALGLLVALTLFFLAAGKPLMR